MNASARELVEAARFAVSERHPYLSEVLFSMPLVEARGLGTMAVDAKWRMYYDPETVLAWRNQEHERRQDSRATGRGGVPAVLFHEIGHIVREHFRRLVSQAETDKMGTNIAQDREINDDVVAAGWVLPGGAVMPSDIGMENGLTAEEYYAGARRKKEAEKGKGSQQGRDTDDKQGSQATGGEPQKKDDDEYNDDDREDDRGGEAGDDEPSDDGDAGEDGQAGEGEDTDSGEDGSGNSDGEGEGKAPGCGGCCGGVAHNPTRWEQANTSDETAGGSAGLTPGASGSVSAARPSSLPPGVDEVTQEVALLRTADAIRQHEKAHGKGSVPGGMRAWAETKLLPAKVDWRRRLPSLVRNALASKAGGADWTWRKPGRRSAHCAGRPGQPIMPSLHQPVPKVSVVLDTSGSMSCAAADGRTNVEVALAELLGVVKATGAAVTVYATDCALHASAKVLSVRDLDKVNAGGGGTCMVPGWNAAIKERPRPDLVVILTDGIMSESDWPTALDVSQARCRLLAVIVGKEKPPAHVPYLEVA